jgi:archaellum component FlaF (FlaF/FlaG flagellin family)
VVSLVPATLTFTNTNVGATSAAQTVKLTNTGSAALNITGVAVSGDFAQTNNCGASVAAGSYCTISVTFTPTATGNRYGSVTITDNAANSPQTILLAGSGLVTPSVVFLPTSLTFPNQIVGTTSSPQNVVLTNTGGAVLDITSIVASGDFAETNSCGATLASGASCTLAVTFTPTASGPRAGAVTVSDNAPGSPQTLPLNGTGVAAPVVTLSPTNLTFSGQAVGTTSSAQTVKLTNTGSAVLEFSNVTTTGDFSQTNNCPASLAAGGSCTISVTFTPTVTGSRYGSVVLTDNAADSPQTIPLAGNGLPSPAVAFSPTSLTFPNQIVNTTSQPLSVTLSNTGSAVLNIVSITTSGDFAQKNTCGTSLANGASCTISVTFTPTAGGLRAGSIIVTDNAPGSPQTVPLTGNGLLAPVVTLVPTSLTFTGQAVGSTSAAQGVTLTNTGSAALNITSITISGDFAETNTCGATVAPGNSCTISVTFTPTAAGNRYGSVTITDNAADSPETVLLAGNGASAPAVAFLPSSLTFVNQIVNTTSAPQNVILTNTGGAVLDITGIVASGDFAETNGCGATLASGASCTIAVTFTPTASGPRAGAVTVTDNAPGSPQALPLSGTGVLAPVVSLSPTNLTFSSQPVGTTSAAQTVKLTNIGSAVLEFTNAATIGDFGQTNTCPASLPAGASCVISVTFSPTATGNRYGSVVLTDSAANSPQIIPLAGSGVPSAAVTFSPTSLNFPNQVVNTTSAPLLVTLTNTGAAAMSITSIASATGEFSELNTCGASLASGASCTISVTFTPAVSGPRAGTITVTDNAPGSPQTVPLTGSGLVAPVVTLAPKSLSFTAQPVGSTSAPQTVTLTNTGIAVLNITSVTVSGDFAQTNTCEASLAPGFACAINVTFTPTAPGNRYGSVTINDNASDSPQTIVLAGDGMPAPLVSLSVVSLTFPSQSLGTTSAPQPVTMSNIGTAALTITSIVATGDFAQINTCGTSLAAGASCTINVTFTPTVGGSRTGSLIITDNAPNSPQMVSLGGSGADFAVSVAPTSATVIAGNSVAYTLTVTPSSGFNARVTLGCGNTPRGASCSVSPSVVTPNGTDPASATVTVTTAARSLLQPRWGPNLNLPRLITPVMPTWFLWLLLLALCATQAMARRRRVLLRLVLVAGLVLLWVACGGGGSQIDVPNGTPAGNYTLTLSGTSGSVTHDISVGLTVE